MDPFPQTSSFLLIFLMILFWSVVSFPVAIKWYCLLIIKIGTYLLAIPRNMYTRDFFVSITKLPSMMIALLRSYTASICRVKKKDMSFNNTPHHITKRIIMNKKVSIITVNYNGVTDTCEMIESLKQHENYPYELIVVDNGSASLNDYTLLKEKYPDAKVIRNDINLGFAEGNNIGVKQATGDYLFFLNNDTIITRPILEILVKRLDSDEK